MVQVNNLAELKAALIEEEKSIEVMHSILIPHTIKLKEGVSLVGNKESEVLLAFNTSEGIALEGSNTIKNIAIQTQPNNRAIYIESNLEDLATITLENLTLTGQVQILTRAPQMNLNLAVNNIDIISSDSRNFPEKPLKYGVTVYQGALTVYNYNSNPDSKIIATIEGVSIGRKGSPVIGTGVYIGGFNDTGGQVDLQHLQTNDIYSNGMIPFGQPTLITAGIFILTGAHAKEIITDGSVTTYGVNDMVLDVWGEVDNWLVNGPVLSYGTSGIGFVNFGIVHNFEARQPIETYGSGARGFNQYDGTIDKAVFEAIKTYGDGSIGMQFSKPVGTIKINQNIETHGASGESLVKGEIQTLDAIALSIKAAGKISKLIVDGDILTHGDDILAVSIEEDGELNDFNIKGNIVTNDATAKSIEISDKAIITEDIKKVIANCIK